MKKKKLEKKITSKNWTNERNFWLFEFCGTGCVREFVTSYSWYACMFHTAYQNTDHRSPTNITQKWMMEKKESILVILSYHYYYYWVFSSSKEKKDVRAYSRKISTKKGTNTKIIIIGVDVQSFGRYFCQYIKKNRDFHDLRAISVKILLLVFFQQ